MADYPSNYPQPILDGYRLKRVNNLIQTGLSTGLMVQREFAPNAPFRGVVRFVAKKADITDVLDWIENTAGLDWFSMTLAKASATGSAVGLKQCRRVGVIDQRYLGDNIYELSMPIEVRG